MICPRLWVLAVLLLAWEATGVTAEAKTVTRGEVLQAIGVFQEEPSSKEGFAAASTIISFTKESSLVHVSLSKAVVPWLKGNDVTDADTRNILLTAYIAGNVASQLKAGKAQDDVYAGWEQVLTTYAELLHINPAAKIPEVEYLKSKEADGTLRAYAAEVLAK